MDAAVEVTVFKYLGDKLKMILPVSFGKVVEIVNCKVKLPVVVAPGTRSAGTEKAAVPTPLAVPPVVIAGSAPLAGVSIITALELAVLVVHTM